MTLLPSRVTTAHTTHERRVEEREAGNAFSDTASNPGGVVQQLVGNLGWGQFKMKKRPDNSSAIHFKGSFDTHNQPITQHNNIHHSTTGGDSHGSSEWRVAATAVAKTAFSDLVARNARNVDGLMQKKNLQGLIDLSYDLDVTPLLAKLQKYNLVFKLGLNRFAPTEALTIIFTQAFIQSFRFVMPGTCYAIFFYVSSF
jgi:hypothetical protein